MKAIKAENLTRKFGDLVAVDRVSLEIEEGELFGMLGPNGAGKTTFCQSAFYYAEANIRPCRGMRIRRFLIGCHQCYHNFYRGFPV